MVTDNSNNDKNTPQPDKPAENSDAQQAPQSDVILDDKSLLEQGITTPDQVTATENLPDAAIPDTATPIKAEPITAEPITAPPITPTGPADAPEVSTKEVIAPDPEPRAVPPPTEPPSLELEDAPTEPPPQDSLTKQRENEAKARSIAEAQQKLKEERDAEFAQQQAEDNSPGFRINKGQNFDYKIAGAPDYARVTIQIPPNQTIKAEASAMIAMDAHVSMKTKLRGGFKRFLTSETLFLNEFTAEHMPGEICLANALPGDIVQYHLDGKNPQIYLQSGAYLASTGTVETKTKWQGMVKGFFSGAGMFLIRCEGQGDLFFNSYGGIMEVNVEDEFIIDTNHIVGFTDGLDYKVEKFGGYKSFFFSGEGLIARFRGTGKIWVQTRNFNALAAFMYPFRPTKKD